MSNRIYASVLFCALVPMVVPGAAGCAGNSKAEAKKPEELGGKPVTIESEPAGARVEVDGLVVGNTPVLVYMETEKNVLWVRRTGRKCTVEVFPTAGMAGAGKLYTQKKLVYPSKLPKTGGRMFFDLRQEAATTATEPD